MVNVAPLKALNTQRWHVAKMTRGPEFVPVARRLVASKTTYQLVEVRTTVPWVFIAVTHERESTQNWSKSLAQGDPWNRVSTHVPAGRGPFASWVDAAYDALVNCGPYTSRNKDWSIGGMLTLLEQYNGLGYFNGPERGRYPSQPSPYIWSGTDQYHSGKYVRDGEYNPNVVDAQLGCAGLIMEMMKLDASIKFEDSVIVKPTPTPAGTVRDGFWLQDSLNKLGADPQLEIDGIVGPSTRTAVRAFQTKASIVVDGKVGPETIAAIDSYLSRGSVPK